jgi:lysophospholipase L1-like esterase
MHGWGYTENEYKAAFPQFVQAIRNAAPQAKLIWTSTTPVRKDDAKNTRINMRNTVAGEYAKQNGIPIDDQHSLMELHQDLHSDDVHFNAKGSELQARQVADSVLKLLP